MSMGKVDTIRFDRAPAPKNRAARKWAAVAAAGALLAGVTGSVHAAWADSASGPSSEAATVAETTPIDLDVVNANLLSVVMTLKLESNAQIVVVGKSYQPVTLTVTAPLAQVLHYVAQSAGAVVTRDDRGVYTIQPADSVNNGGDATPVTVSASPADVTPAPTVAPPAPVEATHWERIVLQHVDPNFIAIMLNDPSMVRNTDPATNSITQSQHRPATVGPDIVSGNPAFTVTPSVYQTIPQQGTVPLPNSMVGGSSATQANRAASPADQAGQFGAFPGGGAAGGGFSPFGGAGGGIPGQGGGVNGVNGVNGQASTLRPQGIDSIIANEQDNSLIVKGTADAIAQLKQIINFVDRPAKQVQIKVEFITTNVADADSFGIQWDMIPFPNVEVGFNGPGNSGQSGSTFLTYSQGNVVAQMQALLSTSKGKLINSQIVTTTNNTPGSIEYSTEIPYQTTTTVAQGSGNAISGNSVNFIQALNELSITPRINGDNSISMWITPELTSVGAVSFSGGPPETSEQSAEIYRTVANGETMVIGGVVQKSTTNAYNEVPFLSNLPIIGSLFRTRNLNISDSELLIFVTPLVLPPITADEQTAQANESSTGNAAPGAAVGVGVTP